MKTVKDAYGSQILGRLNRAPRFIKWMADVIRSYVGEKVLEIRARTGSLTLQVVPRRLYWASDINPLYLTYLKNLGVKRPYMRVGYTDGAKRPFLPKRTETRQGLWHRRSRLDTRASA